MDTPERDGPEHTAKRTIRSYFINKEKTSAVRRRNCTKEIRSENPSVRRRPATPRPLSSGRRTDLLPQKKNGLNTRKRDLTAAFYRDRDILDADKESPRRDRLQSKVGGESEPSIPSKEGPKETTSTINPNFSSRSALKSEKSLPLMIGGSRNLGHRQKSAEARRRKRTLGTATSRTESRGGKHTRQGETSTRGGKTEARHHAHKPDLRRKRESFQNWPDGTWNGQYVPIRKRHSRPQ